MLTGKNVVIVKGDNGVQTVVEYDRVYLEFGSSDILESYNKTSGGNDLVVNGKKWEGTRPVGDTSKTDVEVLVQDAIAYFTAKDSKTNPWLQLLHAASYGDDLFVRGAVQAKVRPSKPLDLQKAREAMAKKMVASGMAKTIEGAMKKIAAMEAADTE